MIIDSISAYSVSLINTASTLLFHFDLSSAVIWISELFLCVSKSEDKVLTVPSRVEIELAFACSAVVARVSSAFIAFSNSLFEA